MVINARIEDSCSVNGAEYFLLSEEIESAKRYGFAVRYRGGFSAVCDVTIARNVAKRIFGILADAFVTPATLSDVIENLLAKE